MSTVCFSTYMPFILDFSSNFICSKDGASRRSLYTPPHYCPDDYPTLVTLSIEAFKHNPFHYLVYPLTANISREEIEAYVRIAISYTASVTNFLPSHVLSFTTKVTFSPYSAQNP